MNNLLQSNPQKSNVLGGARSPHAVAVDFFASQEGELVMLLPITPAAEVWANVHLGKPFLGAWWLEAAEAEPALRRMVDAALVVRLDGRLI
jgi:hypothetical protein